MNGQAYLASCVRRPFTPVNGELNRKKKFDHAPVALDYGTRPCSGA
ncbi:hypothetical protein ABI_30940 [Asticcacaulis biprosthecium C19]|uniref:Uncharacterized protein n=1 Tax=Asticcacaulis biprosthecium C19 TaxID=715226 RepID=F4QN85_9CAUL|nr:hypothetical protein ABI_30940 [Asticcacaulis biprosthecium C19]